MKFKIRYTNFCGTGLSKHYIKYRPTLIIKIYNTGQPNPTPFLDRKILENHIIHNTYSYDIFDLIKYYTFGWLSIQLQVYLYKRRIWWHNWMRGECTPGFECCSWKNLHDRFPTSDKLNEHIAYFPVDSHVIPKKYLTQEIELIEKLNNTDSSPGMISMNARV